MTAFNKFRKFNGARASGLRYALIVLVAAFVTACASTPGAHPKDPWEGYNRGMTQLNDHVDGAVLKPLAMAYKAVTPAMVRTGIRNFFGNIEEVWTAINATLQLKGQVAGETVIRLSINTVFGLGGLLDIAGELNIERHQEDFGQTLGRWGVPTGPYLVLPIYGPSTVRDAIAFGVESAADPVQKVANDTARDTLSILRALELRANLLRAGNVLEEAALDKYTFLRDVFLQRRESLVFDGQDGDSPDARPDK